MRGRDQDEAGPGLSHTKSHVYAHIHTQDILYVQYMAYIDTSLKDCGGSLYFEKELVGNLFFKKISTC